MGKIELSPKIASDKAIRSGKPVIDGTRVPVDLVLGKLATGMTYEEISIEYAISREDIMAVLKYAQRLTEGQGVMDAIAEKSDAGTKATPTSREGRIALAKMVTKLFELWKLSTQEQLALLGLSEHSKSTLARYRNGSPLADKGDLLDRVAVLLSIHRSLRTIFPQNRDLVYKWPKTPNRAFAGKSPLDFVIREGFSGLFAVKRYLDIEGNLTVFSTMSDHSSGRPSKEKTMKRTPENAKKGSQEPAYEEVGWKMKKNKMVVRRYTVELTDEDREWVESGLEEWGKLLDEMDSEDEIAPNSKERKAKKPPKA